MQCEVYSNDSTTQVVEVVAGKPTDRWFCSRHAPFNPELCGPEKPRWDVLFFWLLPRARSLGRMPDLDEIEQHGEAGQWVAKGW
jgi:hypothetical protein